MSLEQKLKKEQDEQKKRERRSFIMAEADRQDRVMKEKEDKLRQEKLAKEKVFCLFQFKYFYLINVFFSQKKGEK